MIKKSIVFCCITFTSVLTMFGSADIFAQIPDNIRFKHLSIEQGLSQTSCLALLQDSRGYLWIGTQDGLNRYDGYSFVQYKRRSGDNTSLSDNYVTSLLEDSQGNLWVGTQGGGLNRFDPRHETFQHFRYQEDEPTSLSHDIVNRLLEDSQGNLWVGTQGGGLNRFEPGNETFQRFQTELDNPASLANNHVLALLEDSQGNLWVGTRAGLDLFNFQRETFQHFQHQEDNPASLSHNIVTTLMEDSQGNLWIGTQEGGINLFDPQNKTFRHFQHQEDNPASLSFNFVHDFLEDRQGNLWIATQEGLNLFDSQSESFRHFRYQDDNPASLAMNIIHDLLEDRQGNLWIGTGGGGLNLFDPQSVAFQLFQKEVNNPASLSHNFVFELVEDRLGNLWAGTFGGGLTRFDPERKTSRHFRASPQTPNSLSSDNIGSLLEDEQGNLWIATAGGGLNLYDPQNESFRLFSHEEGNPASLPNNMMMSLFGDSQGNIWLSTWESGLILFDPQRETFRRIRHETNDSTSLSDKSIINFFEDSRGNLWLGAWEGGLYRFNPRDETFRYFAHNPDDPASIASHKARGMFEDSDGYLWIGTLGGGLNRFDYETETFKAWREQDGLSSNTVYGILADQHGNLWLSTNNGINKFDPTTETFTWYDEQDGLQSNEFNVGAYYQGKGGTMYFGGINGFNAFHPDNITANTFIPPVVLTDFFLFNKRVPVNETTVLTKGLDFVEAVTLEHDDYIFAIEFSALNYRQPEKNQYAYMLEGFDTDWIETDYTLRRATYTNIPPGTYTFRVKASNDDGVWNEAGTSITLAILPPWWRTWWAYSVYTLLVLSFVYGTYRWRVHSITARNRELAAQVTERTAELTESNRQLELAKNQALEAQHAAEAAQRASEAAQRASEAANQAKSIFLANMSHELRTPLNGILGYAQILKRHRDLSTTVKDGLNIIYQSGHHLLTLINDILDLSKIEARKMELTPTRLNVSHFLDSIVGIIHMRAQQKDVRFVYEFSPELPTGIEADEKQLRQVLLNLLGNAVKFTENGGTVTFRISECESRIANIKNPKSEISQPVSGQAEILKFEISDTGVGMTEEQLDKIFEPFEQVGDAAQRAQGTGLGLAISHQLVELMGGTIQVTSRPGIGSTFWFEVAFPVVAEDVETEAGATRIITGYDAERRQKVFVVDDKAENRLVLTSLLEPLGFDVAVAEHGQEAVEKVGEVHPDAILMDLIMPVMNGFEAVKAIRQMEECDTLPILAVSASSVDMGQEQSRRSGFDGFLPKPIDAQRLFEFLAAHLPISWTYETSPVELESTARPVSEADIVFPPKEELETLYELAELGMMRKIRERTFQLEEQDAKYGLFAMKVREIADAFDQEQMIALLRQHLEAGN